MGDRGQRWRRDVHENSRRVRVAMMVRWLGSALDMVDMLQGGRGGCLSVLLVSRACVPEIDARAGVACSDQCMLLAHEICLVTERNAWAPACSRQAKVEASNSPIRPCSPGGDRPGTRASGDGTAARSRPGRPLRSRSGARSFVYASRDRMHVGHARSHNAAPTNIVLSSYTERTVDLLDHNNIHLAVVGMQHGRDIRPTDDLEQSFVFCRLLVVLPIRECVNGAAVHPTPLFAICDRSLLRVLHTRANRTERD